MSLKPFETSRAKISNAGEHIARATDLITNYKQSAPMSVVEVADASGNRAIRFDTSKPMPVVIVLTVGDAIHNLRSALDIMACEVVACSGGNPEGVHFPFSNSEENYEAQIKLKRFSRANSESLDLIRTLKPYNGGNVLLRAVHDLDIADKHKFIIATSALATVPMLRVGGMKLIDLTIGMNGGSDISFPSDVPIEIQGPILPQVVFDRGGPMIGSDVLKTVNEMSELISDIVDAFARIFGY